MTTNTINQTEGTKTNKGRGNKLPKIEKTIEIPTNGISNGKKNYFNFTLNRKMIKTPFFPDQIGTSEYNYDHHINGNILDELGKKWEEKGFSFFSYENRFDRDGLQMITTQSHGLLMKFELYRLIKEGHIQIQQDTTLYKMIWTGEEMEQPELRFQQIKEKKETNKPTEQELEGLDFSSLLK